jgi:hypothetical protein
MLVPGMVRFLLVEVSIQVIALTLKLITLMMLLVKLFVNQAIVAKSYVSSVPSKLERIIS